MIREREGREQMKNGYIRRGICILLAVVFLFSSGTGEASAAEMRYNRAQKELKVLFVGNSMSRLKRGGITYSVEEPLEKLAEKAGYSLDVETISHGGAWLKYYASKKGKYKSYYQKLQRALKNKKWDYIVFQDYSKRVLDSVNKEMYPSMKKLKRRVEKYQPQAQILLYMTHGYNNGTKSRIKGKRRHLTISQMQEYMAQGYFDVGERLGIPVIPVGMQMERCRKLYPEIKLYHADYAGYYLAACCFFQALYQERPDGSGIEIAGLNLSKDERKKIEELVTDTAKMSKKQVRLSVGKSKKVRLKMTDRHSKKRKITYKSLNTSIARVNKKTGRITAVKSGRTLVFAKSSGGMEAASAVYVRCKRPKQVRVERAGSGRVRISWQETPGAKKYRIYRSKSKNGKYTRIATVKSNGYTDKKVKKNKGYYYKVKAVNGYKRCNSKYSRAVYFRVS